MTGTKGTDGLSDKLTRGAPLAVLVAVGFLILYRLLPILEVIALSMLLALVLRTIMRGLESLGAPTWLAVIALVAGIGAFAALFWLVVGPNLYREFRILVSQGPGSLDALANFLRGLPVVPDLSQIVERLEGSLRRAVGSVPSLLMNVASVLGAVVGVVFLAIYFAVSPGTYVSGVLRLVPGYRRAGAERFIERLGERLRSWVFGTLLVALFVGTGGGLGLWLLGVPLPLTFGLVAGVLNVVPYLGSTLGALLPALLALTVSPIKALEVLALFLILNQIEANVLQPLVMGRQVRVPTAMILVSFLVMGMLLGPVVGALLAVPAAVLVGVLLDEFAENKPSLGDPKPEGRSERGHDG